MQKISLIGLLVVLSTFCLAQQPADENTFIEQLLQQMTLEEKVGQMNQIDGRWMSHNLEEDIRAGRIGSVLNHVDADDVRELQRIAVEESRLGIPLLFARDIIHGFKTVYPIPLGQSTTWNPTLAEAAAHQTAIEATQTGVRWTFSPMVDIARDPRWGRIAEGYGEDTYLTTVFGVATVRGYQGQDLSAPNSLAACVKHFVGYSATEGGRDYNTTWIPEVQLRETYLPPFEACCKAGVASIMCSFNSINGLPPSANEYLCEDILRKEWGYDGLMVSDWGSIHDLIAHGVAADNDEATILGIQSHITMDMAGYNYQQNLVRLVQEGKVEERLVDDYVREILRTKYRMGLFQTPYPYQPQGKAVYFSEDALRVAQQCCEESAVLLKNNGVLPLQGSKILIHPTGNLLEMDQEIRSAINKRVHSVYICGPLANNQHDQNGTWCFDGVDSVVVTPLQAFLNAQNAGGPSVAYQKGFHWSREMVGEKGIKQMAKEAKKTDVILYFAGEEAMISGEAKTRAHLNLPGDQSEQIRALKATGKPVVLIVMAGRPLCIDTEVEMVDAVVYAYHGGTMQGPALYNVLTGAVNPSGRLTTTFPHAEGQIPFYYNRQNTGRPTWGKKEHNFWNIPVNAGQFSIGSSTYWLEYGVESAFPFGYGLSYTSFEYSDVMLSDSVMVMRWARNPAESDSAQSIYASVVVTNTGKVAGKEVVQLYLRDMVGQLSRPIRELKGFEKIELQPGESRTVTFEITPDMLRYWHYAGTLSRGKECEYDRRAEPGTFSVWISKDADSGTEKQFILK